MLFKKGKKNIAILMVIAMLLTIMPMTVFAEGEEGAVVTIEPMTTEVTTGQAFTVTATVTTSSAITTPSMIWYVDSSENGSESFDGGQISYSAEKEFRFTDVGDYTIKAEFLNDGKVIGQDECTVVVKSATVGKVNPNMEQEYIQNIIDTNDIIEFEAGTYIDLHLVVKSDKSFYANGKVEMICNHTDEEFANTSCGFYEGITIKPNVNLIFAADDSSSGFFLNSYSRGISAASSGENTVWIKSGTVSVTESRYNQKDGKASTATGIYFGGSGVKTLKADVGTSLICTDNKHSGIQAMDVTKFIVELIGCDLVDLSRNKEVASDGSFLGGSGIHTGTNGFLSLQVFINGCKIVKMNENAVDAVNFNYSGDITNAMDETYLLKIENCPLVEMNKNGSWGTNGGNIKIFNSNVNANENGYAPWGKVTKSASNIYGENVEIKSSNVNANDCFTFSGIWVAYLADFENSVINCNNNGKKDENGNIDAVEERGRGFIGYGTTKINNTKLIANGNASQGIYCYPNYNTGETPTQITNNSILMASGNRGTGIWLNGIEDKDVKQAIITDSTIKTTGNGVGNIEKTTSSNWIAGLATLSSTYIENCILDLREDGHAYGFIYCEDSDKNTIPDYTTVTGNTVAAWKGEKTDSYTASKNHNLYVISGSLQGIRNNMTGTYGDTWNTVKGADEIYAAPINNEGTKLTRFDLHNEVNKEVGLQSEQAKWTNKSFTYYNPNNKESKYDYQFRFNKDGEDLVEGESGNAYVWAPASVLHYDATEGTVDALGTAGKITVGNSTANRTGDNTGLDTRYTQDVTIYGNSLNLAEKTMPTAAREGYAFAGWFVADDEEKAAEYAEANNFTELYKLLNTEFTAASKVATDLNDVSTAQAEKTIYAKWTKGKVDGTIFEDGIRNDRLDDNESRFEGINVKLLKDGVQVATTTTDANGYYKFVDVDFGNYTVEIEWPEKDNDAMDNICAASNHELGNKFTAGADKAFAASQAVTISKDNLEATLNAGFYNTSGGGGSTTDPDPVGPGTDEPTIDIPDQDVPLTEPEEPTIDIEDPDVPLVDVPGEIVEIEEPEVPLGDAPATGDRSAAIPFAVLMLIAAAGLAITRKRFN